jgi:gamma-glutamyltranspeptidase/glutathione hydrolase
VARAIAADVREMGGALSPGDLAACRARFLPALDVPWRGRTLHLARGLTAAPTLRRVLELMADAPFAAPRPRPNGTRPSPARCVPPMPSGWRGLGDAEPKAAESCTTHLTVCDADGMMVAMTTTLLSSMGSRVVLPRSGVLMNNGVMWFDPRPGTPNAVGPRKRPLTNMCPVIASGPDGPPEIACGASGGRRIMAAVFQTLSLVADFGMTPEEAGAFPRIDVSGPEGVTADARLPAPSLAALAQDGPVEVVEHAVLPVNFACPNLIRIAPDGERQGITDTMSPWSAALAQ